MSHIERSNDIRIDEHTTHEIQIKVMDHDGNPIDLNDYDVIFTSIDGESKIEKRCVVEDNIVTVILQPNETNMPNKHDSTYTRRYQVRAFRNDVIYHIAEGNVKIYRVHRNYLDVPQEEI